MSKHQQTEDADLRDLEKVRDLLFGSEVRATRTRFSRVEDRLNSEVSRLRQEVTARFDAFEEKLTRELDEAQSRIDDERRARETAVHEVVDGLKNVAGGLEEKIGQLDESATQERDALAEETTRLREELNRGLQTLRSGLLESREKALDEMHDRKADRKVIAGLFAEFATRLSDDSPEAGRNGQKTSRKQPGNSSENNTTRHDRS